ncbi:MAG TPA: hypothetical protein VFS32_08245 [Candidatus Limnocylindrales bacterium]|nr:hypothetical protein [Candidatus Limnocylindrales bacterium]
MAEPRRLATLDDEGLEVALGAVGRAIAYPRERDLAPLVSARLREAASERRFRRTRLHLPRIRLALLLAAALLVLLAAAVAAGVLGLPGIRILIGSSGPSPTPATTVQSPSVRSPSPAPSAPPGGSILGGSLGLGRPVEPASLDAIAGRHIPLPAALGRPASAWLDTSVGVPVVSLVWPASGSIPESGPLATREPGIGAVLTEIPATVDRPLLQKVLGPDTTIEAAVVNGEPGYWIAGTPHELLVLGRDGSVVSLETRLAGNTLLWTEGGQTFRLESGLTRDAAIAVAATTR